MSAPETFLGGRVTLHCGDSRAVLKTLPDACIHAVVCDPPYALVSIQKRFGKAGSAPAQHGTDGLYARASAGFMGQGWDTGETAFAVEFWREVLRVLKPGGHVVAFGGTRSYHRLACAIEDAGFEIRDALLDLMSLDPIVHAFVQSLDEAQLGAFSRVMDLLGFEGLLAWVYGSGFPKSHDVSKAIDRHFGAAREVVATKRKAQSFADGQVYGSQPDKGGIHEITAPATAAAAAAGWGTALKPAWEPIILARKPLSGTVAETVLTHGAGALNIDGCRVVADWQQDPNARGWRGGNSKAAGAVNFGAGGKDRVSAPSDGGRWPANVVHDGSPEVVARFPDTASTPPGNIRPTPSTANTYGEFSKRSLIGHTDSGSAARFFYSAKADADDRLGSKHPTVKPVDLMQWLCRLVTPPGGVVLDPFAGTGTTGEAAWREGFSAVLIEREEAYQADIRRRMGLCLAGPAERKRESAKARGLTADNDAGPLFGGAPDAAGGGAVYGAFARDAQSARQASRDEGGG